MQADMDETISVRLTGPFSMLLVQVDPNINEKSIGYEMGTSVIYIGL